MQCARGFVLAFGLIAFPLAGIGGCADVETPDPGGGGDGGGGSGGAVCADVACSQTMDECCPPACSPTNDIDCFNAPDSIVVTPTSPSIPLDGTQQFTATGVYDGNSLDITTDVMWGSAVESVATISDAGLASSVGLGNTTISASIPGVPGGPVGSASLRVTAAELESIAVTPTDPSIVLGTKQQFTAMGRYTDGTQMNLTSQAQWSSSALNVATVSDQPGSNGLATSVIVGRATIRATDLSSGIFGESDLNVTGPTTNRAYVANSSESSVSVIDIEDGVVIDTISVNTGPFAVAVHPSANLAYVTHNTLDSVSVIDTTTNSVLTTITVGDNPQSVAINVVKNKAYVGNLGQIQAGNDTVTIINTTNQQVIDTVTVGQDPRAIAVADQGNASGAFVALFQGEVKVIDVTTNAVTDTIAIPAGTAGQACLADIAYQSSTVRMRVLQNICNAPATAKPYITDVFATTKAVDDTYRVESFGAGTAITVNPAVNGRMYVAHPSTDTLSVTEYVFKSLEDEVSVGDFPTKAAFAGSPHDKVLVSNCSSDNVSVVDIATNSVVKTIDVGNCPRGVAVIP